MNLKWSAPASSVMCATRARAAAGSRYSSTKRIALGDRSHLGATAIGARCQRDGRALCEIAPHGQRAAQQIPHLLGGGDHLPGLPQLFPALLTGPSAEHVADHDSYDCSHLSSFDLVGVAPGAMFDVQKDSSSSSNARPISCNDAMARFASCSSIFDMAKPTWIRT